jgi:hypothetical protein
LDWLAHINYIKAIASKRVNILKCVSSNASFVYT